MPLESVTTLLLEGAAETRIGWVLQQYSPLFALLPNLRLLSLWKCHGILAEEDVLGGAWYNSGENIVDW